MNAQSNNLFPVNGVGLQTSGVGKEGQEEWKSGMEN